MFAYFRVKYMLQKPLKQIPFAFYLQTDTMFCHKSRIYRYAIGPALVENSCVYHMRCCGYLKCHLKDLAKEKGSPTPGLHLAWANIQFSHQGGRHQIKSSNHKWGISVDCKAVPSNQSPDLGQSITFRNILGIALAAEIRRPASAFNATTTFSQLVVPHRSHL